MTPTEPDPQGVRLDLRTARHVAVHILAHVNFAQPCIATDTGPEGCCGGFPPGTLPETIARIALSGPCLELLIDLIEDDEDPILTMLQWLDTWRRDVVNGGGFRGEMATANGWVSRTAAWSLAFCEANSEVIDEAAALLMNGGEDSDSLCVRFRGRTIEPDQDDLDAAELSFAGGEHALELVDEAVAEYCAGEHGQPRGGAVLDPPQGGAHGGNSGRQFSETRSS